VKAKAMRQEIPQKMVGEALMLRSPAQGLLKDVTLARVLSQRLDMRANSV